MLRNIIQNCLVASLLVTAPFVYAKNDEKISCPSASLIQQAAQKLDRVHIEDQNHYTVFTSSVAFYDHNLSWHVGIGNVPAKSKQDAIAQAKKITENAYQKKRYAKRLDDGCYSCPYGPGLIFASSDDHHHS